MRRIRDDPTTLNATLTGSNDTPLSPHGVSSTPRSRSGVSVGQVHAPARGAVFHHGLGREHRGVIAVHRVDVARTTDVPTTGDAVDRRAVTTRVPPATRRARLHRGAHG